MPKETLKEMEQRHSAEFAKMRAECKHEHVCVFEGSSNGGPVEYQRMLNSQNKEKKMKSFRFVLIKCADCGIPMVEIDHHGISVYVQPHYMTKGLVLPPDPFDRK